jgi:hypothetical protein
MKALLKLAALALFTSSSAFAAVELPNCWTTDGKNIGRNPKGEEIADGQWLINVQFDKISKQDLVRLLGKVNRDNLNQVGMPIIFDPDFMILNVEAKDASAKLPRAELKKRVAVQLRDIVALPAVPSAGCNGISHPER